MDLVSFLNILLFNIFVESSIIEYISGSKYLGETKLSLISKESLATEQISHCVFIQLPKWSSIMVISTMIIIYRKMQEYVQTWS